MSQTLEELEQTIQELQREVDQVEATERLAALELEATELEEDLRLEAEAQELYDEIEEEKTREEVERGQYTGERIAASVKEMVKSIPEPKEKGKAEFRLGLRDNRVLFNVVSQVANLCEEATFEVTSEGLSFRGMDPSHVALIDLSIPNSCFEVFEIDPDDNAKFGVRIDELLTLFKKFDKKDREITLSMGEDCMLAIKSGMFNAKVRLIESSASSVPLPKLNFNAKINLYVPAVRQVSSFIDGLEYLAIESNSKNVELSSKADTGEYEITLNEFSTLDNIEIDVKEDSKAVYSIDYLKKFVRTFLRDFKAVNADTLTFEYSTKMPARLSYNVLGGGKMHYYIAPRVQD